jgi:putative oxidoreductase
MRRFLSTRIYPGPFNTAMFLLRLGMGILLLHHGFQKLLAFADLRYKFLDFMHLGSTTSLALTIFGEFFCSALVIMGLFTRFAALVVIIVMAVAFFVATDADTFGKGEMALLYLFGFLTILLCGPGRVSIDSMISK